MSKLSKFLMLITVILMTPFLVAAQIEGIPIVDSILNAESWTEILGLYDAIMIAFTLLVTQLGKYIPIIKTIPSKWKAIVVTVIVVIAGILLFGVQSLVSPIVIWAVATMLYDKFVKTEEIK